MRKGLIARLLNTGRVGEGKFLASKWTMSPTADLGGADLRGAGHCRGHCRHGDRCVLPREACAVPRARGLGGTRSKLCMHFGARCQTGVHAPKCAHKRPGPKYLFSAYSGPWCPSFVLGMEPPFLERFGTLTRMCQGSHLVHELCAGNHLGGGPGPPYLENGTLAPP